MWRELIYLHSVKNNVDLFQDSEEAGPLLVIGERRGPSSRSEVSGECRWGRIIFPAADYHYSPARLCKQEVEEAEASYYRRQTKLPDAYRIQVFQPSPQLKERLQDCVQPRELSCQDLPQTQHRGGCREQSANTEPRHFLTSRYSPVGPGAYKVGRQHVMLRVWEWDWELVIREGVIIFGSAKVGTDWVSFSMVIRL